MYAIKDSGKRKQFTDGMLRDGEEKVRYDLIDIPMLTRWAIHMTNGAKKYSPHNWEKANTQESLDRFKESAFRHFIQWFSGESECADCGKKFYLIPVKNEKNKSKNLR